MVLLPDQADRIGPTPETLRKLRPDPVMTLFGGEADVPLLDAALEIRAILLAFGPQPAVWRAERSGGAGGDMPAWVADAHALRFVPWARGVSQRVRRMILDLCHYDQVPPAGHVPELRAALGAYGRRSA